MITTIREKRDDNVKVARASKYFAVETHINHRYIRYPYYKKSQKKSNMQRQKDLKLNLKCTVATLAVKF